MNRRIDKVDLLVALGLLAFVAGWAFLWAHPYPHPDLWPFLAALKNKVPLNVLAVAGKLGLGLFAAVVYMLVRCSWILHRDIEDDLPDAFFFTRFAPLCASVALTCLPYVWRPAQFLAPGFLLGLITLVAVWLWQCCRLYGGLVFYFFAYLLLSFTAGLTPVAVLALGYVGVSDVLMRWQETLDHGQQEEDVKRFIRRSTEATLSLVATVMGLAAAVAVGAVYALRGFPSGGIVAIAVAWWRGWLAAFWPVLTSQMFVTTVVSAVLIASALALGRRIRSTGPQGRIMAYVIASLLGVVTLLMTLRAIDLHERRRLAAVGDYVRQTVADASDVLWLFTDGRFDDALRFELMRQGLSTIVLDALNAPSSERAAVMRDYAPEPGDRDMFSAGGAEVFKAWARERPDRLADSAWQFGGGILRRFGKTRQRTCGSLLRSVRDGADGGYDANDRVFAKFSEKLLDLLERPVTHGIPFGSVDKLLASKCDAMLWRAARQAGERAERMSAAGNVNESQRMRMLMQKLDGCNSSLRSQGNMLERLLPTANLVLTPQESLDIALRRADFFLAQRYANEVLVGSPDNPAAHFALGMHGLEVKDYFMAAKHLEMVVKRQPNEPAALNNLALAYLKLGQIDKAKAYVERAAKAHPKSPEIQKNLAEILKAEKK